MVAHPSSRGPVKLGWLCGTQDDELDGRTPRFREIQAMVQEAEAAGLDSLWLADHVLYRPNADPADERGMWEAFTFLAALAASTTRITLGPMVAPVSFRNPAMLAKMADALDEISDGRFVLGIGAGWHKPEYDAFGYPFDHLATRFEEALQIIVPLLHGEQVDFNGQYDAVKQAVLRPRGPSPKGPRLLIAGKKPRMLQCVARYADAWNTAWHTKPEVVAERWAELQRVCVEQGRDPATLELTCGVVVHITLPGEPAPEANPQQVAGTPEQVTDALRGFVDVGVQHLILVVEPQQRDTPERLARVAALLRQA